jgi:hypothetical protein
MLFLSRRVYAAREDGGKEQCKYMYKKKKTSHFTKKQEKERKREEACKDQDRGGYYLLHNFKTSQIAPCHGTKLHKGWDNCATELRMLNLD